jgi:membrane protein DedA with SNARE-associated domain
MSFLTELHGGLAIFMICAVLFLDEAGVPMPFAPNEVVILLGGVFIRTGTIAPWTFLPSALVAMVAGMLVGFGWSHAVGRTGLNRLVHLLHAEEAERRVLVRLESAGPLGIGLARLLPGVRHWVTLTCGAMGVRPRRFLPGAVPALALWLGTWTVLGVLVGLPVEHALGVYRRLILRGALLVGLGLASYVGLHHLQRYGLEAGDRRVVWLPLALFITAGAIASVVAGVLAIGRGLVGDAAATWLDALLVAALLAAVGGVTALKDHLRRGSTPSSPTS